MSRSLLILIIGALVVITLLGFSYYTYQQEKNPLVSN